MSASGAGVTWRALWVETGERLGGDAQAARWLCEQASGAEGIGWLDALDQPAGERAVARLDAMVARRLAGEPLQYVLGGWAFRRLDLLVDRRVLIPRPETELVAGVAIELARAVEGPIVVADLGTGSGAIGLSLAVELPIGRVAVWLTDASTDALDVARANLAGIGRHAVNVRVAAGSWYAALPDELRGELAVVVSNPPYVAVDDAELAAEVLDWEPSSALFAGADGLDALRILIDGGLVWLRPGGSLVLEIGHRQGPAVSRLLIERGYDAVEIRPDLAGLDRIAIGRRPG